MYMHVMCMYEYVYDSNEWDHDLHILIDVYVYLDIPYDKTILLQHTLQHTLVTNMGDWDHDLYIYIFMYTYTSTYHTMGLVLPCVLQCVAVCCS